jgi:hypothetical protein
MKDGVQVLKTDPLSVESRHVVLKSEEKVLDDRVPEKHGENDDCRAKEEKARSISR